MNYQTSILQSASKSLVIFLLAWGILQSPIVSVANEDLPDVSGHPVYFPAFVSDQSAGDVAFSPILATRLSHTDYNAKLEEIRNASPALQIMEQVQAPEATIISFSGASGRYLHLNLLTNRSDVSKNQRYCHVGEIYLANAQGKLLDRSNYSLINDSDLQVHHPGLSAQNLLDGKPDTVWHSDSSRDFPYAFSLDLASSQSPAYLVFLHRPTPRDDSFFDQFQFQLSESTKAKFANVSVLCSKRYKTTLAAEQKLKSILPIGLPDAAGALSLAHYHAQAFNDKKQWLAWLENDCPYRAIVRLQGQTKPGFNGDLIVADKQIKIENGYSISPVSVRSAGLHALLIQAKQPSESGLILAVDLIPENQIVQYSTMTDPLHIVEPDLDQLHPSIISKMESIAGGHYDIRTTVPQKMKAGQNGYVIITSEEKKNSLAILDSFIRHKESRGFKVYVITEKDYGGGTGAQAAINIRRWLQGNYQSKKLLYALMLGNPHPTEGDVPYKKVGIHHTYWNEVSTIGLEAFARNNPEAKELDGVFPTDYFFVDLSGSWDKNQNSVYADPDDYGAGGIDGQPEIYVGRIPFYGIDSQYGNSSEVDAMLRRIIRYENEAGDLSWRHDIFYSGDTFQRTQVFYHEYLTHNGGFIRRHAPADDLIFAADRPVYREDESIAAQNSRPYGFIYYQEHGSPWGIGGMMSTGGASKLRDTHPGVYALGGCDVASPEFPENLCFSLLRNNGIAVYGGTRSVSSCSRNPWLKHDTYYPRLHFGMSTGEVLWSIRADQSRGREIGGTNFLINLLGDPSIVAMPHTKGPSLSVSPGFEVGVTTTQGSKMPLSVKYEIRNNSNTTQQYNITADAHLIFSKQKATLQPGAYVSIDARVKDPATFSSGNHPLPFTVQSDSQKKELAVLLTVQPKKLVYQNRFESPLTYINQENKPGSSTGSQVKGVYGSASTVSKQSVKLETPVWAHREDYTLSFFQK